MGGAIISESGGGIIPLQGGGIIPELGGGFLRNQQFGAAGTLAVPMFWAYLVLFAVLCVGASVAVYLLSPDLVKERVRPGEGEQDRVTVRALNVLMFAQMLLAGLDVGRLHWSPTVPFTLQILGLIGFAMGMGLTTWAMLVNRFFSSAVRLQPDRGQQVVSSGPYRLVRHPGYSGGLLLLLSAGVALGSWIAIVPILLIVPFMVRRTLIEERMLRQCAPRLHGLHAASPIPDRSGSVVSAHEWAAVLQPQPQGRELGVGEIARFGDGVANGEHEPIVQRPLPNDALRIVARGQKQDGLPWPVPSSDHVRPPDGRPKLCARRTHNPPRPHFVSI